MLRQLPPITDPKVLVGIEGADDAGVYRLTAEIALVQTLDFFPPVVDDPYQYGAIAAANSLSDVYAMGGRPLTAMSIVAFPSHDLPQEVLVAILKGSHDKCAEAGVTIVGGHTIDDREPKYGLAVTGIVHPDRIVRNSTAQPGDVLVLTKPLGMGVITTALKAGRASPLAVAKASATMTMLNKVASEVMVEVGIHACTDITGYGLLGHLYEMASASRVGAQVWLRRLPILEEAWGLVGAGLVPGGTFRNRHYLEEVVAALRWEPGIVEEARLLLCDAQTSGGLLIAVAPEKAGALMEGLRRAGVAVAAPVGEIVPDHEGLIRILP